VKAPLASTGPSSARPSSALYEGRVVHRREGPRVHAFGYRVALLYLDLDELPELLARHWFTSHERTNVIAFRRADYFGDPAVPLADAVRACVEERIGRRPRGAVRMLTQLRTFGYVFNPVSFYYCFDEAGELDAIAAEITNTPWRERHTYVLDAKAAQRVGAGGDHAAAHMRWSFAKEFHVSPFFDMAQAYQWTFAAPGDRLSVHMTNVEGGRAVFHAGLELTRRELTGAALAWSLVRHPLLTWRVHLAIYWQALRLHLKRTPFFVHPKKRVAPSDAAVS
jgi:DUF1365 family protein